MAGRIGGWRVSPEGFLTIVVMGVLTAMCFWPEQAVTETRDTAYRLANAYRHQRYATAAAQARTDTVTRVVTRADANLEAQSDSLTRALAWADSVAQVEAATSADLRVAVQVATSRAATFQASVLVYRDSVRELIAAHALERLAVNRTLAASDSTIAAWQAVADAERRSGRRKFLHGVFVGAVLGVVVVGGVTAWAVAL